MAPAEVDDAHDVHCRLDELLAERGLTLTRLAELVGVSVVNLSVLKNDRARAIRFSKATCASRISPSCPCPSRCARRKR